MDPATGGALAYGAETAVEAGVAAYFLTQPTLPLKARLQHVSSPASLSCSGYTFSIISDRAYIFGGHSEDGKSESNEIQELRLTSNNDKEGTPGTVNDVRIITAIGENGEVSQPRLNRTAAMVQSSKYRK